MRIKAKSSNKFLLFSLLVIMLLFIAYALLPTSFLRLKSILSRWSSNMDNAFLGESVLVINQQTGVDIESKRPNERRSPASLAKLFVVDYALSRMTPQQTISVSSTALNLPKHGSSLAHLTPGGHPLSSIIAAMLVPSGNDAAYALADYMGHLDSHNEHGQSSVDAFIASLNKFLADQGYLNTYISTPDGYDWTSYSTARDIAKVSESLLRSKTVRDIVRQPEIKIVMPNSQAKTLPNTNEFLHKKSIVHKPGVIGIKTGSLGANDYNLAVLYQVNGKEFLIISLGSESDYSRYKDVQSILNTIDRNNNPKPQSHRLTPLDHHK